jgi:hypothetical protein
MSSPLYIYEKAGSYLFIYSLFKNDVSISNDTTPNGRITTWKGKEVAEL